MAADDAVPEEAVRAQAGAAGAPAPAAPTPTGAGPADAAAAGAADDGGAVAGTALQEEHRPRLWPLFGAVALLGLGADIGTKFEAVDRLEPNVPVRVLGPLLSFRLIRNPGAAFSQGEGFTWVFAVAAVLVLAFVLVRLVPRLGHPGWAVALGLLVGGVSGNLLDRLTRQPGPFRGHVVDFLQLPHWPIFNVADMCITGAAVMVVVLSLFKNVGVDGQRPSDAAAADREVDDRRATRGPEGDAPSAGDPAPSA